MNTDNSCSSTSMSKKRESFEKEDTMNNNKPVNGKRKKFNAHSYKKLFKIAGQKMKEDVSQGDDHIPASNPSNEVEETPVINACSDSKHEKHRFALDSEGVCFDNAESANDHSQMEDIGECETVLKTGPTCGAELAEFQFKVTPEARDHALPYVNKLRDYWHRRHNSVIFDGEDRIIKVVFFILSILDDVKKVKKPILIITSQSSLSLWESQFSKWNNSTNIVTYKDKKCSTEFQVLLSSPDVIIEDFEMLDGIKWELIVIDESQRPIISRKFEKIKKLTTDMKLLMVTSETFSYQNILSILDSEYKETDTDADVETNKLKEKLSPFVAFECKFNTSEIEEYWVPVHLSNIQIEKYCSLLNSKFEVLTSSLRNSSDSLHDILTQTQKCCDHPYLVDPNLRKQLKTNSKIDRLEAEIDASGKLQLLDKFLSEIKRRSLRVLVLYQSLPSSEKITIGDILEDLVDRRFGQDSYVRIQAKIISPSMRKEALSIFNNVESDTFICLMDYHDCQSTIKLLSVDVVILFNSDRNPSNDLKALHRITIDSNCNGLKVFRFYSSFTIEEKALILAEQDTCLESSTSRPNYKTCHQLLAWGASYLFNSKKSKSNSDIDDLVHELSSVLMNKTENNTSNSLKRLNISKAIINDGVYSRDILLTGENEEHTLSEKYFIENGFNLFWGNLLKESRNYNTRGKSLRLAKRVKTSSRNEYYWFGRYEVESESETESDIEISRRKKITSHTVNRRSRSKRNPRKSCRRFTTVRSACVSDSLPSISSTSNIAQRTTTTTNIQPPQLPPVSDQNSIATPLETELENINKEKEKATKLQQEKKLKLDAECEKELLEIRKKYDALIDESEICLAKEKNVLEEYYDIVYANKVLAETIAKTCDDNFNEEKTDNEVVGEIRATGLVQSEWRCTTRNPRGRGLRGKGIRRGRGRNLRSSPSLFASLPTLTNPQTQTELNNVDSQVKTEKI